ncbi:hypothetical protein NL501_31265, partial [Klebsiella pneumoniae]|nr:hypothetical protein [Klebsiella pneumoniae]
KVIDIFWPNEKPYHERVIEQIKPQYETQEEMILRLITKHKENVEDITVGERYYNHQPDVLFRCIKQYVRLVIIVTFTY